MTRLLMAILIGAAALLTSCGAITARAPEETVITVDPNIRYQTIIGWEAVAEIGQIDAANDFLKWRDPVADMAVNELGLNRLRVEIYSGIENPVDHLTPYLENRTPRSEWKAHRHEVINDNDDPNLINWAGFQFTALDRQIEHVALPLKARLQARGEDLHINVNYVQGSVTPFEHLLVAEEYAEMALAVCLHLRDKYGLTVDSWEMALEPDGGARTPEEIGRALVATGRHLKARGFTPRFIAPSTTAMSNALGFFDRIVSVPGAREFLSELSYHRYSGVSKEALLEIAKRGEQYNVATSMLEHIGSGYEDLHEDLKTGRVAAWQQFALAYPGQEDGAAYIVIDLPKSPVPFLTRQAKLLSEYFRTIRAGAVRVAATADHSGIDPLAFINQDGRYVVVLLAQTPGAYAVQGLPPGRYAIRDVAADSGEAVETELSTTDGTVRGEKRARGLVVIFSKPGATAEATRTRLLPVYRAGVGMGLRPAWGWGLRRE